MPSRPPAPTIVTLALMLGATSPAQEVQLERNVAEPRFDLEPTMRYLTAQARSFETGGSPQQAAWVLLAGLANGSTMRSGPFKDSIKLAARALKTAQGEDGCFRAQDQAIARADQLLAVYAVEVAFRVSSYLLLKPIAVKGFAAAHRALTAPGAPPPTADEVVVLRLLMLDDADHKLFGDAPAALVAGAKPAPTGKDRREDAAAHFAALLAGQESPPELTVARCWPPNPHADPLQAWYSVQALQRTDAKTWQAELATLDRLLAQRATTGDDAGAWPAVPGLDQLTTTAMLATVVALANQKRPE